MKLRPLVFLDCMESDLSDQGKFNISRDGWQGEGRILDNGYVILQKKKIFLDEEFPKLQKARCCGVTRRRDVCFIIQVQVQASRKSRKSNPSLGL